MLKRFSFNDFDIVHFLKVGSTNDFLEFQDQLILADRLVIWADRQMRGKGRRGRSWQSQQGNLSFSLYLNSETFKSPIYEIAFLVAVAVYDTILDFFPMLKSDLKLKWPNDLLLDKKKCAGILIEHVDLHAYSKFIVIGMGLNLNHSFGNMPYPTVALKDLLPDIKIDPQDILTRILSHISDLLEVWKENGFDPILHRWQRAMIHQKGDRISIEIGEHREDVSFEHIAHDGSLMYRVSGHLKKHFSGDVILK